MGAGSSTGKLIFSTNDLRTDLAKLISNKSNYFWWWTIVIILIFATIMALSWYVFIEVEEGKFWNAEHKGIYYNRAIIGTTIGLHLVLFAMLVYVSNEYYKLLKREDNFITDIAVLGDVSKLSENARPSLEKMIKGRLGESAKNLKLPAVGALSQYLSGTAAAGQYISNTIGGTNSVLEPSPINIPYLNELQTLGKDYDKMYQILKNDIDEDFDIYDKNKVPYYIMSLIAGRLVNNPKFDDWCPFEQLQCNDPKFVEKVKTNIEDNSIFLKNITDSSLRESMNKIRAMLTYLMGNPYDWGQIESLTTPVELKRFLLAFKL